MTTAKKPQATKAKSPLSRRVGYTGAKYGAAITVGTCRKLGRFLGATIDASKEIVHEVQVGIREYRDE